MASTCYILFLLLKATFWGTNPALLAPSRAASRDPAGIQHEVWPPPRASDVPRTSKGQMGQKQELRYHKLDETIIVGGGGGGRNLVLTQKKV